jgi:hypothetical protein
VDAFVNKLPARSRPGLRGFALDARGTTRPHPVRPAARRPRGGKGS